MSIQDILAQLQKDYVATIPGKILSIESNWRDGRLRDLHTEYHKLKGTGRTYGLPEISQIGEALECICETQPDALNVAVPLSLAIMARIQEARQSGQGHKLDSDPDFAKIVALLNENAGD